MAAATSGVLGAALCPLGRGMVIGFVVCGAALAVCAAVTVLR
jgi:hypothetical protein